MAPKKGFALIISSNPQFLKVLESIYKELEYQPVVANTDILGYSKFKNQEFTHVLIHVSTQTRSYLRLVQQLKSTNPATQIAVLCQSELTNDPSFPSVKSTALLVEYEDPNNITTATIKKALESANPVKTKDPKEALKGRKALVVDDEEMVRSLLREFLEDYQCHVSEAKSGDEAVKMALTQKFDFVLLDFMMPGFNGDKALELIRKKFSVKELPVLVASGQSDMENIKKLTAAGISGYIVKPIELSTLLAKITNVLK